MVYRLPRFSIVIAAPELFELSEANASPSDDVSERKLSPSKIPDTACQQDGDLETRNRDPGPIDCASRSEQCPPEAVNDTNHRVQRVEKSESRRNDAALKSNW